MSGDGAIHTGSSVGLCVVVEDLLEKSSGSENEESKTKVRDLESRRKKSSGSDMD